MCTMKDLFHESLLLLEKENNLRQLPSNTPLSKSFISNDYLGLAEDNEFRKQFFSTISEKDLLSGSTGSRLLSGNYSEATLFEKEIATSYQKEAALLFNSGYHANVGILSSFQNLPRLCIVADRLCHASIVDGILLSKKPFTRFHHNDLEHLSQILLQQRKKGFEFVVVVVESIYSMDGDKADLKGLCQLKRQFPEMFLYVDEAHALGVEGKNGLGLSESTETMQEIDFIVGTFGKSFASMGAFVVGSSSSISYLLNHSRSFIFSTMLPPIVTAWNHFVWDHLPHFEARRKQLRTVSETLRAGLFLKGYPHLGNTHIIPLYCKGNKASRQLAAQIASRGFGVKAIHAPTVPQGTERIRLSLSAAKEISTINQLLDILPPYSSL